jgi:hypothetical protein
MELRYAPDLLDEAVARELRRRELLGESSAARDWHVLTDEIYGLPPGERDARFREANALFFRQLGLGKALAGAASGFRPAAAVAEIVLDRAVAAHEEEAELHSQPPATNVRVRVRVERFDDSGALEGFLRHELRHVEDMLRPEFGYRPVARLADRPAEENLVRARLRLLWNLAIAGALERAGARGAATREAWERKAAAAYPGLGDESRRRVVELMWKSEGVTWARLLELARSMPELLKAAGVSDGSSGARSPGGLCPLCGFPTFDWADAAGLDPQALAPVRADYPDWKPEEGACRQCLDSYVLRARFASAAPVPTRM